MRTVPQPVPPRGTLASRASHQLAVAQATLRGPWTRATLHPLLLALGRPRGEHRGINREGGLSEILMLEAIFCIDPSPREICQEPGENSTGQWAPAMRAGMQVRGLGRRGAHLSGILQRAPRHQAWSQGTSTGPLWSQRPCYPRTHLFIRSNPWSESRAPKRFRRLLYGYSLKVIFLTAGRSL
jgi:hypothetical protein